jgi:peptidoglycan/LPS O-acetylase OafA/YrhL
VAVGKRSYGLYLWHFPIFITIDATLSLSHPPARVLAVAITAIVVPLSYRYIEQPFLRMKDGSFGAISARANRIRSRRQATGTGRPPHLDQNSHAETTAASENGWPRSG